MASQNLTPKKWVSIFFILHFLFKLPEQYFFKEENFKKKSVVGNSGRLSQKYIQFIGDAIHGGY